MFHSVWASSRHHPWASLSADITRVCCKQDLGERSVCLWSELGLGWGGWHYSLEPHPLLSPKLFAHFTRGLKWGMEGSWENMEEEAVCFLLCVNNTTSVPQPGSWTKVKWCEHSLPSGSESGEWEKEGESGAAGAEASPNNRNSNNNENVSNTTWQADPGCPRCWVTGCSGWSTYCN